MNMLEKIFPKTHELTVFVITVVLYMTIITNLELFGMLIGTINLLWTGWVADFSESTSIRTDTKLILGLITMVGVSVAYLIGPLFMPFTKKDIRFLSIVLLWVDISLIIYWNMKISEPGQWYRVFPVLYSLAWLIYSLIVLKFNKRNGINMLVSEEQTNPKAALKVASTGIILSVAFVHIMKFSWLDAYMMALFITR